MKPVLIFFTFLYVVTSNAVYQSKIQDSNIFNLNLTKNIETQRRIFDEMKKEFRVARYRHTKRERDLARGRETKDSVIIRKRKIDRSKDRTKTEDVHREYCYRMLEFTADGVKICSLIGLEDKNKLVAGGVEKETESIFQHAENVLSRNGVSLDQGIVYSVDINLVDENDTQIVDEIFQKYFQEPPYPNKTYKYPNNTLPLHARIEVQIFATMTMGPLFKRPKEDEDI